MSVLFLGYPIGGPPSNIRNAGICLVFGLLVNNDKNLFIVFFHVVLFAGKFLQRFFVSEQLVAFFFGLHYLRNVVLLFLFYLPVFCPQFVLIYEAVFVKKTHPHQKGEEQDFVFVFQQLIPEVHSTKLKENTYKLISVINRRLS